MNDCSDRECRDGIYNKIDDKFNELKVCLNAKADKLPKTVIVAIIGLMLTLCTFVGGGPLMYSIVAAKDKQLQINENHERIQIYNVKQDVMLDNQKEFKQERKEYLKEQKEYRKELDTKLEKIMNAIKKGNGDP